MDRPYALNPQENLLINIVRLVGFCRIMVWSQFTEGIDGQTLCFMDLMITIF